MNKVFLSGKKERKFGLTQSFYFASAWSKYCIHILVITMMVLDYYFKMVGGFQKMFTHGSVNMYVTLSCHLCKDV